MKKIADYVAHLTLGRLLILLSVFSLTVAFVLIFFMSEIVRDRAVHELARDNARQTSKLVFQSLYSAMRKGWSKQEVNDAVERLNIVMPDTKIRVYRGEIVRAAIRQDRWRTGDNSKRPSVGPSIEKRAGLAAVSRQGYATVK